MYAEHMLGPTQIILNVTNRCNMRCQYCFNDSGPQAPTSELTDAEIGTFVDYCVDYLKPHNVCFTGGEPLLRGDLVVTMTERLTARGIRANLLTNGLLLDTPMLERLLAAQIGEIQISLDGPDAQTHGRTRGSETFAGGVAALRRMQSAGYERFGVCMTLTGGNWDRVDDMMEFMADLGVPVLHLRPRLRVGRAAMPGADLALTPTQTRAVRRAVARRDPAGPPPRILFPDPLSQLYALHGGETMFHMEISACGDLVVSPYLQQRLGNIRERAIHEYWAEGWWQACSRAELRTGIASALAQQVRGADDALKAEAREHYA